MRPWTLVLLLPLMAAAQTPSAAELLKRSGEADQRNGPRSELYAYREYVVNTHLDKDNKPTKSETETWDVVGLEGAPYRKLILRNDKPLTAKEQKSEDKRAVQEAEKRRKQRGKPPKNGLGGYSVGFSKDSWSLYDVSLAGEESIHGRPAYVVEGLPKAIQKPANDNDKNLLHYRVKVWIDKDEFNTARFEMEVIKPGSRAEVGSIISFVSRRLEDGTWVVVEILMASHDRLVTTRSNFQKFVADSRIVDIVQ